MYLYSLTLQKPTGIICAINGSFSGGKSQEIAFARGKLFDLLRPDENGKLQTLISVEIFGAIRSFAQFRLTGAQKDYKFKEDGKVVELLHKTQVEGVPLTLCQFQGRLLAGIGTVLRLYDLGKRRLLRKCENKMFPNTIMSIHTYRDRIYVGDMQEDLLDEIELDPTGGKIKWSKGNSMELQTK